MEASHFLEHYTLSDAINPFYLRGDFDGDGKIDYAILVTAKNTNKRYVVVCRSGTKNLEMLAGRGATTVFDPAQPSSSKDNFNWMDAWQVAERLQLESNELNEEKPLPMKGEGILAEKTESASVLIYWTGKDYHWYQIAD